MMRRKIETIITNNLDDEDSPILLIEGARQVGKSFIIRELGSKRFKNYVELNMVEDVTGPKVFENVRTTKDFYMAVQSVAGSP